MHFNVKDLTGQRFGKLSVLEITDKRQGSAVIWKCKCDCGNICYVRGSHLSTIKGNKSCGCLIGKSPKRAKGEAGLNNVLLSYKRSANKRNLAFELTKEDIKEITSKNCLYCGQEPKQLQGKRSENSHYLYNGIDRVDNTKGYVLGNVVPCCKTCNRAKDAMTQEEFLEWIRRVYEYQASY